MPNIIFLVQKNSHGKVKFLQLTREGNRITRVWGLIGGATQSNFHDYEAINVGKINEMPPDVAAQADLNRVVEMKMKEGYIQTDSLEDLPDLDYDPLENINLDAIDPAFCCSKPTQKVTPQGIDKLIKTGNAKFFVKYNGLCHYMLVQKDGEVAIFTRRWDDHTAKYPAVVEAVKQLSLPPETLMIVELCVDPTLGLSHMWAFKRMSEISKLDTVKGKLKESQHYALNQQQAYPVRAAVFAFLYHEGEQTWHWPYQDVWDLVVGAVKPLSAGEVLFLPQEAKITSGKQAFDLAKAHKTMIEGFIMWDMTQSLEVTMNGKPKRRAAWKVKTLGEMDVIAWGGEYGKKKGLYGSLKICRLDAEGTAVDMGTVGGLKHKEGEADPSYWKFPCVIEVTYTNVFPDTGLLQFGSFSKRHEDKTIAEVDIFSLDQ